MLPITKNINHKSAVTDFVYRLSGIKLKTGWRTLYENLISDKIFQSADGFNFAKGLNFKNLNHHEYKAIAHLANYMVYNYKHTTNFTINATIAERPNVDFVDIIEREVKNINKSESENPTDRLKIH